MNPFAVALILLGSCAPLIAQESPPTEYPVRGIPEDSEKFTRIYEAVAEQLYQAEIATLKTHEIEILQTIAPNRYRVRIGETTYAMEIPLEKPLADGETVRLPALETDEVFQYTTVLGGISTIKVATLPDLPKKITMTQFLILLHGGMTFEITMGIDKIRCDRCGGFGYKSSLAKIECPHCHGRGIFEPPKKFSVYW